MSTDHLDKAIQEVLQGAGLNQTARKYDINNAYLSAAVQGHRNCLNSSLNRGSRGFEPGWIFLAGSASGIAGAGLVILILSMVVG